LLQSKAKYIAESLHNRSRPPAAAAVPEGQVHAGSSLLHERQIRGLRLHWAARVFRAVLIALLPLLILAEAAELMKHVDFAQRVTAAVPKRHWLLRHTSLVFLAWWLSIGFSIGCWLMRRCWLDGCRRRGRRRRRPVDNSAVYLFLDMLPPAASFPILHGWLALRARPETALPRPNRPLMRWSVKAEYFTCMGVSACS
jgi:hypothetical protein